MKATDSSIPPTVLDGRYRVEDRLGGGGTSDVYRARDLRLGRPVAVKLFRARAGAHSDRRCGDEARLLATLNHPGLVDMYDAGWHDDREFLVLRLVEGRTLGRRIAAGRLAPGDVIRIGSVLAEALHHVHARGIVHRDVKPSNILCGDDGTVFLTDFGISHPTGAEGTGHSGVVVGTAPYLAPEQVQGGPIGPPCDVYALGLVLLECLTGKREYPGGQLEAAMARLHREPVIPDHAPAPLGRLIRSMTALDPSARPSAAQCRTLLTGDDPEMRHAEESILADLVAEAPLIEAPPAPAVPSVTGGIELLDEEQRRLSAELPTAPVILNPAPEPDDEVVTGDGPVVLHPRPASGAHRRRRPSRHAWAGVVGSALRNRAGAASEAQAS